MMNKMMKKKFRAHVVKVPRWKTYLIKIAMALSEDVNDVLNATRCGISNKNILIAITILCYSLMLLLVGFSWAVVNFRFIGN